MTLEGSFPEVKWESDSMVLAADKEASDWANVTEGFNGMAPVPKTSPCILVQILMNIVMYIIYKTQSTLP